jgi:uncharacterized protein (TIGR02757 family)
VTRARARGEKPSELKGFLDRLAARYDTPTLLHTDPLAVVYRFEDARDREVTALLASALAYGKVGQILRSVDCALERMGESPHAFVASFVPRDGRRFDGWVHRFNTGRDLALLCMGLRQVYEGWGSLGAFFAEGYDRERHDDIGPALQSYSERFLGLDFRPLTSGRDLPKEEGLRWFFASPALGSACKRLNLQLRWMVRREGLDLGLWTAIDPGHLVIPLDTHVTRIATYLGLTKRRTAGWPMALEVTRALRALDPADPIRYDWALCRLGILDHCPRKRDPEKCSTCTLFPVCQA